jgi:hypothetical protein
MLEIYRELGIELIGLMRAASRMPVFRTAACVSVRTLAYMWRADGMNGEPAKSEE